MTKLDQMLKTKNTRVLGCKRNDTKKIRNEIKLRAIRRVTVSRTNASHYGKLKLQDQDCTIENHFTLLEIVSNCSALIYHSSPDYFVRGTVPL